MRRKKRNLEAREITARSDRICAETGKPIKKGERCVYYPIVKKVYHIDSDAAQDFREIKFDEMLGYNY